MSRRSLQLRTLEREVKKLRELAYKDQLTGLYNRHGFREESKKFIAEVSRGRGRKEKRRALIIKDFALILFDADHFKHVNDRFGHQAGDRVLKVLGELIVSRVRDLDIVARWGGEEIVVGLVGANEDDAYRVAEGIRAAVERKRILWHGKRVPITVSAGVSSVEQKRDFESVFHEADRGVYEAKYQGRNMVIRASELPPEGESRIVYKMKKMAKSWIPRLRTLVPVKIQKNK